MLTKPFRALSVEIQRGVKNSLYLTVANLLTTLITLVGFVYIPNRLGVHDFGIYTLALSFVALFHVFGFNGLHKVIIRETLLDRTYLESTINNLFNFQLTIALIQMITIILIAMVIPSYDHEIILIIILASHLMLFKGLRGIPTAILQAHEEMKTLAKINVTHSLVRVLGIVTILFFVNDLILVMLYILMVNLLFIFIYYRAMGELMEFHLHLTPQAVKIPKKYLKQGFVFTLIGVGSLLSTKIDLFMLSLMGEIKEIAIYGLSEKIIAQFEMLRGVILTAFYPIVIQQFNKKILRLKSLYLIAGSIFFGMALLALFYSSIAQEIIPFLYAQEYHGTIEISVVLFFYLVFFFANLPFSTALQSVGLERYILYMYPFSILLNVTLNYYLYQSMGVIGFAYSTLVVQAFILLFLMGIGSYQLKKKGFVR